MTRAEIRWKRYYVHSVTKKGHILHFKWRRRREPGRWVYMNECVLCKKPFGFSYSDKDSVAFLEAVSEGCSGLMKKESGRV